ncbi:MAG: hypothetical protein QME51_11120 [Planctomycetota bacterium]|nr:hypothetical protein [Planctomycetota bacterium]MDI6788912.1 hypothetical protein [Planctomycetota bacterium]
MRHFLLLVYSLTILFLLVIILPVLPQDTKLSSPKDDISLIKDVFNKIEDSARKKDINAYMEVFSKRVEIETSDKDKLFYEDIKEYLVELFDTFDNIKEGQTKELEIKIKENTAEVISTYRLSGVPKGEKKEVIIDEGALKLTLIKLPSFSPKIPSSFQIIKVSYLSPKESEASENNQGVSEDDKKVLLERIKENYGIDITSPGGFDLYRSLLLLELKAENDAVREETEARRDILKRRLQKTFSRVLKEEIQKEIQELEQNLRGIPTVDEINTIVENEIADLKEIFLKK